MIVRVFVLIVAVALSAATIVLAQTQQTSVCTQPIVFRLCVRNWSAGGTEKVCESLKTDQYKYNKCRCDQIGNHAYCFSAFCPDDPFGQQRRLESAAACAAANNATPTIQTSALLQPTLDIPTGVQSTAGVTTPTGPTTTPVSFNGAGVFVPSIIAGIAAVLFALIWA
ncbi:hypothetical protein HDU97_007916 [Phlyctochytrium planicorne]|nr:hypothetical protein HDU97_007916 [Phlyctochytrium planicorne]